MTDVVRHLEWREGNRTIREEPSPRARMQCTPAQMRIALLELGRLDEVEAIAASDPVAKIAWEYETVYVRKSPWIAALGA